MARVSQLYAELGFDRAGEMAEWINHNLPTEKAYTVSSSVSDALLAQVRAKFFPPEEPEPGTSHLKGQQIPEEELLALVFEGGRAKVKAWLQRGDGAACYRNEDIGHPQGGHLQFVSFGSPNTTLGDGDPPTRLPDFGGQINWRYQLCAWAKRGPACGHSACSQNYIDTGERACVESETPFRAGPALTAMVTLAKPVLDDLRERGVPLPPEV